MKIIRPLLVGAALLVLLIGGVVFYALENLDRLVEEAIETHGSAATGTPVRVDGVRIALKEGRGTVGNLTVANPQGFPEESIFSLGNILIDIDPGSLAGDVQMVEEIRIENPIFHLAVNQKGKTNVAVLEQRLREFSPAEKERQGAADQNQVRLRIQRLVVTGGQSTLDLTAMGKKRQEMSLPAFTLSDLGGKEGATPSELAKEILAGLTRQLEQAAKRAGLDRARQEVRKEVEKRFGEGAGKVLEDILDR